MDLLRLLRVARWLSTSQIHRCFFAGVSFDATRKRVRKLVAHQYLVAVQPNRMSEALFTLGKEGKRALERQRLDGQITLERRPPKQIEHLIGINDIRIAAERAGADYVFACWELSRIGWQCAIIPDAVFSIADRTYAVEFDRGEEGIRFFVRSKIPAYCGGLGDLQCNAVLIVTESNTRMVSLAKMVAAQTTRFLHTTIDLIRTHGLEGEIFWEMTVGGLLSTPLVDATVSLSQVKANKQVGKFSR